MQKGFNGRVVIISRENNLPIDRTKLSKSIKIDVPKIELRSAQQLKELDVEIMFPKVSIY